MKEKFCEAQKIIIQSKNILLVSHENPDGDAVGSLLAMKIGLNEIGKKTAVFLPSKIPSCLSFLPHAGQIKNEVNLVNTDLIIGLDYGHYNRLGLNGKNITSINFLTIDHHLVGERLGLQIVDNDCSSTAEILYELFPYLDVDVNHEIATCLLTGIYSDTGGFRYPSTSAHTLKIVGELLLKGAPLQKIAKLADDCNILENLDSWTEAFKNLKIDLELGMVFSYVTAKNSPVGEQNSSKSAIASLFCTMPEIKFVVLCTEKEPGHFECSLRSQNNRGVNVGKIAQIFGGGGHRLTAGFYTTARPEEIISTIKNLPLQEFCV